MRQTRALSTRFPAKSLTSKLLPKGCLIPGLDFETRDQALKILRGGFAGKLFLLHALAKNHRQIAARGVEHGRQALRR